MIADLADTRVVALLVMIHGEVPADVDTGCPLIAVDLGGVQLITDRGTWLLDPQGLPTRLWPLPGGGTEVTRWSGGVELAREIITDSL
ncbi:MAG: hypothetical protein EKK42_33145 [Pseudonocardiaceae bacterium]|nr:MAG: hypothetical protein EKK42_33145 [Pseudonocardiaceae bacterium]